MIDPYKMIVVNLLVTCIGVLAIIIYRRIFPKKKINYLFLVVLVSLPVILSTFRTGVYESGDFRIHIHRTIAFYNSLSEGNFYPSWAGDLNGGLGYPVYIFNYTFPYYVMSVFHLLGFSYIFSAKLFLAVNYLLSGIFMYLFVNKLLKNNFAAFTSAIFYQFAPFHLIDQHFKVAIGEIMILTLLPVIFYMLLKLWETKSVLSIVAFSFMIAILSLSHVAFTAFILPLLFAYVFVYSLGSKSKTNFILPALGIILGVLSTLHVWVSPFLYAKYTVVPGMTFTTSFHKFFEFLYTPWRGGFLFQGPNGEIPPVLGYFHILAVITLIYFLLTKKIHIKHKFDVVFWLIAFISSFLLMNSISEHIWKALPILKSIVGGPGRFLMLTTFISSILAGYLAIHMIKNRAFIWMLIIITIFSTILNWGHRRMIPDDDKYMIQSMWQENVHFYAISRWLNRENPSLQRPLHGNNLVATNGKPEIKEFKRKSTSHSYVIYTNTPIVLNERTMYFPGWQVLANNGLINSRPSSDGLIEFYLPPGMHYVEVVYDDIFEYKILKATSMLGVTILLLLTIIGLYKPKFIAINKPQLQ